jgi:hypothetical protein
MPRLTTIPNNTLLRDKTKLYVKRKGFIYPLAGATTYKVYGYDFDQAINVPHNVLSPYDFKSPLIKFLRSHSDKTIYEIVKGQRRLITLSQLTEAGYNEDDVQVVAYEFLQTFPLVTSPAEPAISLRVASPLVNLREGPGTGYEIVHQAAEGEQLTPIGRTQDNTWYKATYQGNTIWVAASVVELTGDPEDIPIIEAEIVEATPTPEPTPTPSGPIRCNVVPIRGFGKVWADHVEIQRPLRCPWQGEQGTNAAVQHFQHGTMFWVEQDSTWGADPVYVLFDDHTYQRFGDMRPADPAAVGHIPSGFYPVGDKFSAIYWEGTGVRVKERLGYPTSLQQDSPGAFQQFGNGRMFWVGVIDRIFVIFERSWTWNSYKDTF